MKNQRFASAQESGKKSESTPMVLGKTENKNGGPQHDDAHKQQVKKRERKALEKSFTLAQLSTASMGKFDKKISKKEPDAP